MREFAAMDASGRAEYAQWRSALYGLASQSFLQEPSDEKLSESIRAARSALDAGEGWSLDCEHALLVHLASLDSEDSSLGTRVRSEYAELFVGPRPPLAPLYESLYRGSPRRLLTETTKQVRDEYECCGLAVARRNQVPDDHIGYELEFMAELAQRESEAVETGDADTAERWHRAQAGFLARHLGRWVEAFSERVGEAPGSYYRGWAAFVRDFVAEDSAWLSEGSGE
ncbi:molecular chaperone [uncultured Adlercreutzia sp.]|uniref:TorD/DmsD family molecular chaperone n=1 Tax=uncultured Adlercreutzia sp. TaxID=875803 RepID=UPI0026753AFE|nr:molecular chaperone TorD family protein [uncultured Adlercreutzia sp.]